MRPNESILIFRDKIIQFYKIYEKLCISMTKFLSVIFMLSTINGAIGYEQVFTKWYMIMGIALVCTLLPLQYIMLLVMIFISIHLLNLNLIIGLGSLVLFLCLYILFIRLYPKESLFIIITMLAFKTHLYYALPIIAGLFGGFAAIVGILIGVVGVFSLQCVEVAVQSMLKGEDMLIWANEMLGVFLNKVIYNSTMLATMSICLIVFALVYIIRRQVIDYAPYIAIVIGGTMNLLGFVMAILFLNISVDVFLLVIMTILSVAVAVVVQFISKTADYSRSESVQFEDEDNYYFVKVVPKIKVRKSYTKVEKVYTPPKRASEMDIVD